MSIRVTRCWKMSSGCLNLERGARVGRLLWRAHHRIVPQAPLAAGPPAHAASLPRPARGGDRRSGDGALPGSPDRSVIVADAIAGSADGLLENADRDEDAAFDGAAH
jgi:hypothetical protein